MEANVNKAVKTTEKNVSQAADVLVEKFKEGGKAVNKKIEQADSSLSGGFSANFDDIRERAIDGYEQTLSIVKKYPLYSFLGAAAVGVLATSLIRRSRRS
ncbi:MAG: hypothetical protein H7061_12465 [Bdellovibrionaceae bacterium]|nr:hypothetical protein [Bdellovibrio sp.]